MRSVVRITRFAAIARSMSRNWQAVDLRVAVGVAALHVDQRDVGIERRHEQQLLSGERDSRSRALPDAGAARPSPSIERIGRNGTPIAPARKRMPIAMWLHSSKRAAPLST